MRFLTWNIQNRPSEAPNREAEGIAEYLRKQNADLLFLQEIPAPLLDYLSTNLKVSEVIGVGRDDGERAGEFVPILILSKELKVHSKGWFWLGPTPEIPSRSWFALCPRLCTWAILEKQGTPFFVVNNHWDHFSFYSRRRGWEQVLDKWRGVAPNHPALFTGDFNLRPTRRLFHRILKNRHQPLQDLWAAHHRGPLQHTFTGFAKQWGRARVDHFLGTRQWQVRKCEILPTNPLFSDHRPLLLEAGLNQKENQTA